VRQENASKGVLGQRKGREGKGREGKGREGKGREGKGREGNAEQTFWRKYPVPTSMRTLDVSSRKPGTYN